MSQNKDDKSSASRPSSQGSGTSGSTPAAPDGGLPKRPVPTIDLKATEIKATEITPPQVKAPQIKPEVKPATEAKPGDVKVTAAATASTKSEAKPAASAVPQAGARLAGQAGVQSSGPPVSSVPKVEAKPAAAKSGPVSPPPTAMTAPGVKQGSGIGRALSTVSAAVLGGLLALFGADFLAGTLGLDVRPGASPSPAVTELTTRLAKLEQRANAPAPAAQPATAAVQAVTEQVTQANDRITKLEGANRQLTDLSEAQARLVASTTALEAKVGQGTPADAPARITKLEETLQGLAALAQAQPGRPVPELARLGTKLTELEAAVAALRKSGGGEATAQIEARLAEARKAEAQMTETMAQLKAESAKRLREIEAVKTQAERLESRVDSIKTDAGVARSNVDTLKTDVTTQLQTVARQGDLKATVDVVDKRVAGIETKLEVLAKRDDERQANSERIVASLQLTNLKRAMDQGKPFGEALADVEKVAGGLIDVAPLKAYRDKGVPSASDLGGQFRHLVRTVLEAEQDKAQTTTVNRLLASAKSVVQVRRTGGDVQGDTAEAVLARAEHHLKSGDLDTTVKEMKTLKPELRGVVQGWLDQLEARVTVDRALKAIEEKLKTSMAGAAAGGKGGK